MLYLTLVCNVITVTATTFTAFVIYEMPWLMASLLLVAIYIPSTILKSKCGGAILKVTFIAHTLSTIIYIFSRYPPLSWNLGRWCDDDMFLKKWLIQQQTRRPEVVSSLFTITGKMANQKGTPNTHTHQDARNSNPASSFCR